MFVKATAILLLFIATTLERAQATNSLLQAKTTKIPAFHFRCTGTFSNTHSSRSTPHSTHYAAGLSRCRHRRRRQQRGPHDALLFAMDARGDGDDDDDTANTITNKEVGQEQLRTRSTRTLQKQDRFVLPVAEFIGHNNDKDEKTTIIRLGIESGPLIGGPPWLPLHAKVVLQQRDSTRNSGGETTTTTVISSSSSLPSFAWDFVPVRARDEETFKEIMQLRSVPGKIRFFASGQRVDDPEQLLSSSSSSFASVVVVQEASSKSSAAKAEKNDDLLLLYQWANHAQTFCNGYTNRDLHFIFNNCWTFALQLCVHLLLLDKQQGENKGQ